MIKIEVDSETRRASHKISGTTSEILAELITAIRMIYKSMGKENKVCALLFKAGLTDNLPLAFGEVPEWTQEVKGCDKEDRPLDIHFGDAISALNALCDRVERLDGGGNKKE